MFYSMFMIVIVIFTDGEIVQARFDDVAKSYGLEEGNPSPATSQLCKTVVTWSEDQTRLLLSLYRDKMEEIGPLKRYRNKKEMWESISKEIAEQLGVSFTASQVENRFKNVAKKNKDCIKNNRTSGSSIIQTPFDKEMSQIAALDDSIEPEIILTPTFIRRKTCTNVAPEAKKRKKESGSDTPTENEDPATPSTSYAKREKDLNAQLLEEYKAECTRKAERERQKMERHKEKMEKLDQLTHILTELSKKI